MRRTNSPSHGSMELPDYRFSPKFATATDRPAPDGRLGSPELADAARQAAKRFEEATLANAGRSAVRHGGPARTSLKAPCAIDQRASSAGLRFSELRAEKSPGLRDFRKTEISSSSNFFFQL